MTSHHTKGSRWRRAVAEWFEEAGFRTTVRGIGYAGDDIYAVGNGALRLSVECKNHREITLAAFVDQAVEQAHDYEELALPVVIAHRRGKAQVDDAYVVLPGWAFIELVTR